MQRTSVGVGLIGFGAIARELAALFGQSGAPGTRITVLLRPGSRTIATLPAGCTAVTSVADLLALEPDIVVEAAGHEAVATVIGDVIAGGVPVVVTSVGSLADASLLDRLLRAADRAGTQIMIPSGAVGGIDYVGTLRDIHDAKVVYTSRKPPAAWSFELAVRGIDPCALRDEVVLFEGSAAEAARLYPQNLNVAATIALAGIGMERTQVRILVDPTIERNTHEIRTESRLGCAIMRFENFPSLINPKTSAVTAYSVYWLVLQRTAVLVV